MILPFTVEIAFRLTCSICKQTVGEYFQCAYRTTMPDPVRPDGWNVLNGQLICDKHVVKVETDEADPVACSTVILDTSPTKTKSNGRAIDQAMTSEGILGTSDMSWTGPS